MSPSASDKASKVLAAFLGNRAFSFENAISICLHRMLMTKDAMTDTNLLYGNRSARPYSFAAETQNAARRAAF